MSVSSQYVATANTQPHSCSHCRALIINPWVKSVQSAKGDDQSSPKPILKQKFSRPAFISKVTMDKVIQGAEQDCKFFSRFRGQHIRAKLIKDLELVLWGIVAGDGDIQEISFAWGLYYPRSFRAQTFTICASADNVAQRDIPLRPINFKPGSPESFQLARKWLTQCTSSHPGCPRIEMARMGFMPKRLIEIVRGGGGKSDWQVRLCYPGNVKYYAALSYCWGGNQLVKTVRDTVKQWADAIPWLGLPQTIRDALITANELGIGFLWVDALCIIQDDPDELAQEISKMPQIYSHAQVTISAARASNVQQGFLHDIRLKDITKDNAMFELPYRSSTNNLGSVTLIPLPSYGKNPLASRAWALQENILSPRVLEYGRCQMRWHCQHAERQGGKGFSDGWTSEPENYESRVDWLNLKVFSNASGERRHQNFIVHEYPDVNTAMQQWQLLIEAYTKRTLTIPSDRILAISGLAERFGMLYNVEYLAGLWRFALPVSLLWRTTDPLPRPDSYQAPSWSWVAINTPIKYPISSIEQGKVDVCSYVVECQVQLLHHKALYGAVFSGYLTLKTRVRPAKWLGHRNLLIKCDIKAEKRYRNSYARHFGVSMFPDALDYTPNRSKIDSMAVLLLLIAHNVGKSDTISGLVVRKVDKSRYSRVGMFTAPDWGRRQDPTDPRRLTFQYCQEQVITIV